MSEGERRPAINKGRITSREVGAWAFAFWRAATAAAFLVVAGGTCRAATGVGANLRQQDQDRRARRFLGPILLRRLHAPGPDREARDRGFPAARSAMCRSRSSMPIIRTSRRCRAPRSRSKWYDTEQVDVIVDVVNSAVAFAVQEIARSKGKAVLYSEAGSADLTGPACAPYSAQWTYDTYQLGKSIGEAVPQLGQDLVHPRRRLRVRQRPRRRGPGQCRKGGRQGRPARSSIPSARKDMSSFMLQAQEFEGRGDRAGQCRRRHVQLDQGRA